MAKKSKSKAKAKRSGSKGNAPNDDTDLKSAAEEVDKAIALAARRVAGFSEANKHVSSESAETWAAVVQTLAEAAALLKDDS